LSTTPRRPTARLRPSTARSQFWTARPRLSTDRPRRSAGRPWRSTTRDLAAVLAGLAGLAAAGCSLVRLGRAGRGRHRLGPNDPGEFGETVSMVVPARDEAGRVGGCVEAIRAQDAAVVEVVVVDDGSRDGTAAEAARAGARVEAAPSPGPGVAGKAAACAHGAGLAIAGRWLAFVDADVVLAPEGLSRLLAGCLADGAAAASPLARQATRTWWEELLLPDLGLAVAERLDLDAVADPGRPAAFLSGQCLLVRRDAYDAVGGFGAVAGSLVEDVALARRLKAAGHRLQVRLAPELATVRMYGRFGDLWEGLAKNLAEVWGAAPRTLGRQGARALAGLAPWLALAARPGPAARRVALAGGLLQLTVRAGGRLVAGADPRFAPAYPVADLVLLAVYADSVRRRRRGAPLTWKGRTYPAPPRP
jgi:cellulose synthase/poly-beta-1,6-N-acetylglucosamine synthase-like glycosyltransferase